LVVALWLLEVLLVARLVTVLLLVGPADPLAVAVAVAVALADPLEPAADGVASACLLPAASRNAAAATATDLCNTGE
jgi:hypothetical protein